ncbi:unnamed protein product [Sphagnum balticum]
MSSSSANKRSRFTANVAGSSMQQPVDQSGFTSNGDYSDHDKYDKKQKDMFQLLGFRHWFVLAVFITGFYTFATFYVDTIYPPLTDADDFTQFSETRTRRLLDELVAYGPRSSGSHALEVDAVALIRRELTAIDAARQRVHRLEINEHRPSGCFDLSFLADFTLCYQNVTNIVVRIGPAHVRQTDHSLLVNCHIDSMPDCPG